MATSPLIAQRCAASLARGATRASCCASWSSPASLSAESLAAAFPHAYSGRLQLIEHKGGWALDYCTGQYWPTEYRAAACAVLASALWTHVRSNCMPPKEYHTGDGKKFATMDEAREHAEKRHADNVVLSIEERYNGMSAGDWIRKHFRREFGATMQKNWFD